MKRIQWQYVMGTLLILFGVVFLLDNFNVIQNVSDVFFGALFAVGGAFFLYIYLSENKQWWALIPGFVLLGLGVLISLDAFLPQQADDIGGPLFLASISIPFWIIYLRFRGDFWWALIPAGVMLTLALIAGAESLLPGLDLGGTILFFGMGLTFFIVGLIPTPAGQMRWAFIPAVILTIMGFFILALEHESGTLFAAGALILVGLYQIYRALRPASGSGEITSGQE
jgi:drug/metabolite transporter superfamily protein YnfA